MEHSCSFCWDQLCLSHTHVMQVLWRLPGKSSVGEASSKWWRWTRRRKQLSWFVVDGSDCASCFCHRRLSINLLLPLFQHEANMTWPQTTTWLTLQQRKGGHPLDHLLPLVLATRPNMCVQDVCWLSWQEHGAGPTTWCCNCSHCSAPLCVFAVGMVARLLLLTKWC